MRSTTTAGARLEEALAAIAEHNPGTNAFVLIDEAGARAAARAVDEERRRGVDRGPLHGMPISVKDLIDVTGQPTTAASRVRREHVATHDAQVVQRLREAGAVLIGKTNLHEFALGTTSEESAFGPVRNPRDLTRSAGGSSGGSAAAVATGMGVASIGTDTGGSIRIPAAACGVVGIKPSVGEVPTEGVVPLSKTLDHVGPLARTVEDAANVWAVIAARPIPRLEPPRSFTLGALGGYFTALLTAEVRAAFDHALERLRSCGVTLEPRTVRGSERIVEAYTNISLPEAAHWHAPTLDERSSDYQAPVRERLERGRAISAVSYLRAMDTREQLRAAVDAALEGCDALVLPTLPIVAPPLGAVDAVMDNSESIPVRSAMLRLTQLFNLTGHPAISLPIASTGMPVGMQLVGHRDRTVDLLSISSGCARIGG
ncbi:MAG TPA: amidase [Gemmatimonadaceae bacterium]|jgi:aspartyl-tRNA(Asn)/glutamyl-tRNA(Gln) amidotransferase subunit A|nr:amidase [Gemmatimonadaceae bacterium]